MQSLHSKFWLTCSCTHILFSGVFSSSPVCSDSEHSNSSSVFWFLKGQEWREGRLTGCIFIFMFKSLNKHRRTENKLKILHHNKSLFLWAKSSLKGTRPAGKSNYHNGLFLLRHLALGSHIRTNFWHYKLHRAPGEPVDFKNGCW